MARSRNIKPGFFTNDLLGEMEPLARLLFAGLWTLCDREGRVEDRPKKIKAEVLPYDNCDADVLLRQLAEKGFILRYRVGAVALIQVLAWEKHQYPHVKEVASTLPAPCLSGASTEQAPESTGRAPDEHRKGPEACPPFPAPARLIPSSLIPDSLSSDSIEEPTALVDKPAASRPDCPTQALIDLYHEHCPTLPRVEVLTATRRKTLATRWAEVINDPDIRKTADLRAGGLDWFAWYFSHAGKSKFLSGRAKDWKANFDWLINASNFAKVIEGNYHREEA
jgi:hypothetical protein